MREDFCRLEWPERPRIKTSSCKVTFLSPNMLGFSVSFKRLNLINRFSHWRHHAI
jgi:hypothetical protein